jgi:hypothetical protein
VDHDQHPPSPGQQPDRRHESDEALLADLTSPPPLEQARESYTPPPFDSSQSARLRGHNWRERAADLPVYTRAERKEAQAMAQQWKERLAQAERARYGPSLLEQLLTALGVRRPPHLPSRRKIIAGLSIAVILLLTILILLIVAAIVLWPHIEPIIRDLISANGGGG